MGMYYYIVYLFWEREGARKQVYSRVATYRAIATSRGGRAWGLGMRMIGAWLGRLI
jgi:hypothetical protein